MKKERLTGNNLKAMVVVNPNNPTGAILDRSQMEEIVEFCVDNNLVLIASEVLQDCVHSPQDQFISFRKVIAEMPGKYKKLELFSYHSASKANGFNCSGRSSFLHAMNLDSSVMTELYKHISMDICSSIPGQIMLDLALSPLDKTLLGENFVKRYNDSILFSKINYKNGVNNLAEMLKLSKLFKLSPPKAGFTYFIELLTKAAPSPLCELYLNELYDNTKILCTKGTGKIILKLDYGNFPNHIGFNMCSGLGSNNMDSLLNFNETFSKKFN